MKKYGLINFNTTAISDKIENFEDKATINLGVTVGDKLYDKLDIKDLIKKIEKTKEVPRTSLPSMGEILKVYDEMLAKYEYIFVLTPNKDLSGTHQNSVLTIDALKEKDKHRVHVIHTRSFAFSEAMVFEKAIDLIKEDKELNEIIDELKQVTDGIETYIIPGDLNFIKKSGRINNSQLIVGKLLSLKVLVKHIPGKGVEIIKKARGLKKLFKEVKELLPENVTIYYAGIEVNLNEYEEYKKLFEINGKELRCYSPILASHFGANTLAFAFLNKKD